MKNVSPASALWYHHSRNKHGGSNWIGGPFVEFSKLNCITARQIKPKSQKLCWNAHMAPEDFFSIFVALGYVSLFYSYSNFKCIFLSCEMHSLNFPWGKLKALIYGQLCANLHVCTYRTNNNCSCGLDLEVEMYCPWFSFLEHKICFPFWKKVNAPSATGVWVHSHNSGSHCVSAADREKLSSYFFFPVCCIGQYLSGCNLIWGKGPCLCGKVHFCM